MNEASARGKNNEIQNPKGRGVNLSIIFDEIACWRMYFSWPGALAAILLGLAPSAWDVSSDYVYAQTWDETGYNPQIRALVYFFICLPHLMAVLNAVNSWIINLLDVPSASTPWRHIGTSAGILLSLGLLSVTAYGALKLGLHHPDVFAYLAVPSGAITICIKIAGIFVQGPEAKRALILLTARF